MSYFCNPGFESEGEWRCKDRTACQSKASASHAEARSPRRMGLKKDTITLPATQPSPPFHRVEKLPMIDS